MVDDTYEHRSILTLRPYSLFMSVDEMKHATYDYKLPSFLQPRLKEVSARMWRDMWGEDGCGRWERVVDRSPFEPIRSDEYRKNEMPKKALRTHVSDVLRKLMYAEDAIIQSVTRRGGKLTVEFVLQ